jgi:hypothetical protein
MEYITERMADSMPEETGENDRYERLFSSDFQKLKTNAVLGKRNPHCPCLPLKENP